MACHKCTLRLIRQPKKPRVSLPTSKRTFHTSPPHNRLGAFTYAQEWSTGTYHYNKALSKTLPTALQSTEQILNNYATQQKRHLDPSNPLYAQLTRQAIAYQRRQQDRILIGKPTVKEFVDRVEVTAFLFDGVEAAAAEKAAFLKKLKARKEEQQGQQSASGKQKRGQVGRRRAPGGMDAGAGGAPAPGGARRTGGFSAPTRRAVGFAAGRLGGAGGAVRRPGGGDGGAVRRPAGMDGGAARRPGEFTGGAPREAPTMRRVPGIGSRPADPPSAKSKQY